MGKKGFILNPITAAILVMLLLAVYFLYDLVRPPPNVGTCTEVVFLWIIRTCVPDATGVAERSIWFLEKMGIVLLTSALFFIALIPFNKMRGR